MAAGEWIAAAAVAVTVVGSLAGGIAYLARAHPDDAICFGKACAEMRVKLTPLVLCFGAGIAVWRMLVGQVQTAVFTAFLAGVMLDILLTYIAMLGKLAEKRRG